MESGQLLGALSTRATASPKQPFAWMVSGQQTGKEEAASSVSKGWPQCESREISHWLSSPAAKPDRKALGVIGNAQLKVPPVCFPFGGGRPQGASVNERGSQRWEMLLGSIKEPIESCTVSSTHSGAATRIKLLSSLHTLKVWLLADRLDSLGVKEKAF